MVLETVTYQMELRFTGHGNVNSGKEGFQFKHFHRDHNSWAWAIWKHMNEIVFDGVPLSLRRWKHIFKDEFGLVVIRAKPTLKMVLDSWLSNFH